MNHATPLVTFEELQCLLGWAPAPHGESTPLSAQKFQAMSAPFQVPSRTLGATGNPQQSTSA